MNSARQLLAKAQELAAGDVNWAELSNALFDQESGMVAQAFPSRPDREEFMKTPEYRAIRKLIQDAMERTGVIEGSTPRKSGKFVVRVPTSLHAALEREANEEGVSLNQLIVAKLAVQLKDAAGIVPLRRKSA